MCADDEALSSDSGNDSDEDEDVAHFICCQFEKVSRTKNRWKIAMKEGVFHVHGACGGGLCMPNMAASGSSRVCFMVRPLACACKSV